MKKRRASSIRLAAFALAIHGLFAGSTCRADDQNFWQLDKKEHATLSAAMSSATYTFMRAKKFSRWESFATGLALSLAIGMAKEITDPKVDIDDIRADIAGATGGAVLSFSVDVIAF